LLINASAIHYIDLALASDVNSRHDDIVTTVAPRTGKIIKNGLSVFERGEDLLHNILHFVFTLN